MKTGISFKLMLVFALLFAACGQEKGGTQQTTTAAIDTTAVYDSVLAPNFYKRMEGTIAGQPVIVHLQCYHGVVEGMYYYLHHGAWILLNGTLDSLHPNNLTITESNFSDGETVAVMETQYKQGSLKGSWRSADGKKSYLVDLKESYPSGAYTFTTLSVEDSMKADPKNTASPQATVSNRFVVPLDTQEEGKWMERELKKILHIDTAFLTLDLVPAVRKMNGQYFRAYGEEVRNMDKEEAYASFMNYEDVQHVSICYNENGFVILNSSVYAYSGGAHGNGGSSFYCLDVTGKKELKLRNVLSADSASLQPIVEAAFRKQQGLKAADSLNTILFENHLATTDNFYFTNTGIGFYYFPYEVAAYAVGPIHVFVSFTDLKRYLRPDFAQRMKL